jgi:hypothetical protein
VDSYEVDEHQFLLAISAWFRRVREAQISHYAAATRFSLLARLMGLPSAILSAVTGTAIFATLGDESTSNTLTLVLGSVSILVAALVSANTFLDYGSRAERHRGAASTYGSIRREIEQLQILPPKSREALSQTLLKLRKKLDEAANSSPEVPGKIWKRAQANIAHTARPHGFSPEALKEADQISK